MNRQTATGIEWTHVFGPGTGYTWNPVGGCLHDCRWQMPDGAIVECYAKAQTERMRSPTFYPLGFEEHYWHSDRLSEPGKHKTPAGIFLDSMADLMGHWTPADQVQQVLDVCRGTPQHIYFLLTKNAPRLLKFKFPPNVWVGVSVPPTFFMGHRLTLDQQLRYVKRALSVLADVKAPVRWLSAEPLSFDVAPLVAESAIEWIVIGAASNGRQYYQPAPAWVGDLHQVCDRKGIAVFHKGNLKWHRHRAEFPAVSQLAMEGA